MTKKQLRKQGRKRVAVAQRLIAKHGLEDCIKIEEIEPELRIENEQGFDPELWDLAGQLTLK
jgi:hypothetical protein